MFEAVGRAGEHEGVHPLPSGGEAADGGHPGAHLAIVGQSVAPPQLQLVDVHGQPQCQEQRQGGRRRPFRQTREGDGQAGERQVAVGAEHPPGQKQHRQEKQSHRRQSEPGAAG